MIIRRLTLKNFLTIYEKQTIEFPSEKETSITLIIAPNNSGKTTIIRALKFLFYGFKDRRQIQNTVNLEKLRNTVDYGLIDTYVEAEILNGGRTYKIKRLIEARNKVCDGGNVEIEDNRVEMIEKLGMDDKPYRDPIFIESVIKQMVPEGLFNFFFFKGEELSDRLINPDHQDSDLYEGLAEVLYKDKWDDTLDSLKRALKSFNKKFRSASGQSKEASKLSEEKDQYIEADDSFRAAVASTEKKLKISDKKQKELDDLVLESIPEKNNIVKARLIELKKLINKHKSDIKELTNSIKNGIGNSGSLFFLTNAFKEAYEILEQMHDSKLLPPDISESILNSILKEELCLCGTRLPKGGKERENIKELKERALAKALSNELFMLFSRLKADSNVGYPAEKEKQLNLLANSRNKLDKALMNLSEREGEYKQIEREYDEHADVTYKKRKRERDEARKEYIEVHDRFKAIKRRMDENKAILQQIDRKLSNIKTMPRQAMELYGCVKLTEKLISFVENIYKDLQNSFVTFLQKNVSKVYEDIVTDASKAVIDKETLLPHIERAGIRGLAQGGGQSQTLVLSYIMALSKLRKNINKKLRKNFHMKVVDDQCFFMDSVFAPMEGAYRAKVAAALPGKMKQLILLVAPQQWDNSVSLNLKGNIDVAYKFLIRTNKVIKSDEYIIDFFGENGSQIFDI